MRRSRLLVLLLAPLILAWPGAAAAVDASGSGIEVRPDPQSPRIGGGGGILELGSVLPATRLRDAVVVRSNLPRPQDVHLYAADAVPARGGGFGFDARTEPAEQVGAWLTLSIDRVTVPAGGQVRVPFLVTVPTGTPGGEYVGGVIAEPVVEGAATGVQTLTRFAMAVYLRVPGGAPGATPGRGRPGGTLEAIGIEPRFEDGRSCPIVRVRNESQDILDPEIRVTAEGSLGGTERATRPKAGAVLPGTETALQGPCVNRPMGPGEITALVVTPDHQSEADARYTWLPWPFWVAFAFLLLLIGALLWLLFRRRGKDGDEEAERAPS